MDSYSYRIQELSLRGKSENERVRRFLAALDLRLDNTLDGYFAVLYGEEIVGGAGYGGNVVKCVGVHPHHRGEGLMAALLSRVLNRLREQGARNIFLFTKPDNEAQFRDLSFWRVEATDKVLLMETDKTAFPAFLRGLNALRGGGGTGAVIMNCNPFTLGHLYLAEQAACACARLLVFVVEEDVSVFPFATRYRLVKEGLSHLPNVTVLSGGPYIVSRATFPTYFLPGDSEAAAAHTLLDATLFGRHIAPAAGITVRYVGDEPFSAVTRRYNETLRQTLPAYGVELRILPRREIGGAAVSASRVRALLGGGRTEQALALVPECTARYLASEEARGVLQRLAEEQAAN